MGMVLVPGFTQTAAAWDPVRAHLPPDVDVVALNVPVGLDFAGTAHALGDAGGRAVYVGYSQGGRLCLQLALDQPELVRGLALVSATPGIADPDERAERHAADEQLAREIERDGVDAFLERWLEQPLFASLPSSAAALDARRAGNTVGSLTHALRSLGQGTQLSLWDRLGELTMPVLVVAGTLDGKYLDIAVRMAGAMRAEVHSTFVAGAGHAVHLEQPEALAQALHGFHHELTA